MQIGERIRALFAPQKVNVPQGEQAWSESMLYGGKDFPKYNPDDLIGRRGFGVYRRMMQDEQVKAVVKFRRDAITARAWYFEAPELDDSEEAEARVDLAYATVDNMRGSLQDALNCIMSGMWQGYSLTEKVYQIIEHDRLSWVGLEALRPRPFDTFEFRVDAHGRVLAVVQKLEGREQEIDLAKFVHYVNNPDLDEHYGQSDLREAYRAWFSKDMIIKFQNIFLERSASGLAVASPKEGRTLSPNSAEYASLQTILKNLGTSTSLILPSGIDLDMKSPQSNPAYEAAIAQHDKAIAKALLVPNLMGISEQGSTGSYSQSQTQLEAFLWTLEADARRLEETLNEQLWRDLGQRNWGDVDYPRFRFKPVSDAKKHELAMLWKDLVTAGAVTPTLSDEQHIREMLDIPARAVSEDADADSVSLNGEQVTAIVDIATRVAAKDISEDAAVAIITAAFPIDADQAREMVKPPEKEPVPAALQPGNVLPPGVGGPQDADPIPTPPQSDAGAASNDEPDETVRGVGSMKIDRATLARAMARVDFSVIEDKTESLVESNAREIAALNTQLAADLLAQAKAMNLGTAEGEPTDIQKLSPNPDLLGKMKRAAVRGLQRGWMIGSDHALREVEKARGKRFASNDLALQDAAAGFLQQRGFEMTGSVTGQTKAIIEKQLLDGIKASHTFRDVEESIYTTLRSQGLIDDDALAAVLSDDELVGAILGTGTSAGTAARIHTIARTNIFQSLNEARYGLFSDPDLDGFVEALEFSAVLDDRTTEVCEFMNGRIYPVDSDVWQERRPPLHHNCRSLLIAVTERDTWKPSPDPSDKAPKPQQGFGL